MTSQWQVELDDAGRQTETSRGLPARPAAALLILVALTFIDATPRMAIRCGNRALRATCAIGLRRGSCGSRTT